MHTACHNRQPWALYFTVNAQYQDRRCRRSLPRKQQGYRTSDNIPKQSNQRPAQCFSTSIGISVDTQIKPKRWVCATALKLRKQKRMSAGVNI